MATGETVHKEMLDAFNRRDFEAYRPLLHDDYTYTGGDGVEIVGPDAGVEVARGYATAIPDGRAEITMSCAQRDTAVCEFRVTGTHGGDLMGVAPTGKSLDLLVCNVIELRDGKVYREREYLDSLEMWVQLGVLRRPGQE